ncbi:MAG: hypothetical protein IT186_13380 [Acidobacteria bacterium]|nr:hypothetical protein [Acidobacteriota bacterium]MCG3190966.1 hypothetical protein [Thermoanaerobaculia bacterium]MCK6684619.1 hypothetical protein [Thermoanaerobaculia bacterium]
MEHNFLHTFELAVEGLSERLEFSMYFETADVKEATDAFAAYVARQEDNFLPLGLDAAVRAHRIYFIRHVRVGDIPLEN